MTWRTIYIFIILFESFWIVTKAVFVRKRDKSKVRKCFCKRKGFIKNASPPTVLTLETK